MLFGTMDTVLDPKSAPFRIILHTPDSDVYMLVAVSHTREEIDGHWAWLEDNVLRDLSQFNDSYDDVRQFVSTKIGKCSRKKQYLLNVKFGHNLS